MSKSQADPSLFNVTNLASELAIANKHEYVLVEHLMRALLSTVEISQVAHENNIDVTKIIAQIDEYLATNVESIADLSEYAKRTFRVTHFTTQVLLVSLMATGKPATSKDLFAAIIKDNRDYSAQLCTSAGLQSNMFNELPDMSQMGEIDGEFGNPDYSSGPDVRDTNPSKSNLSRYCTDLTAAARAGTLDKVIGRSKEIDSLTHVLARRKKNNAVLVGAPGVGKTAIIAGLAEKIANGTAPASMLKCSIHSLDVGALLAEAKFRGDMEGRIVKILAELKQDPNAILFIDEIHMIMGAGASSGSSMDVANLIKPALQNGDLRCIGATTFEEYRKYFEKDGAMARRFLKIAVDEPSPEEAKIILQQSASSYERFHNKMRISHAVISEIVDLSVKFMHGKKLPDKAFDLLDSAAANLKVNTPEMTGLNLTIDDVRRECSRLTGIPLSVIVGSDTAAPQIDIEVELGKSVFGQAVALATLANAIYVSQAGLKDAHKPTGSYLFTGPTGVGKTETVKAMARAMAMPIVRFDMSEFKEEHTIAKLIGSPPGYVGYGDGDIGAGALITALDDNPTCIILLDEVEKAHPSVLNIFLQFMDNGIVTGSNGKSVSARNSLLIMTSNLGATSATKRAIGFGNVEDTTASDMADIDISNFFAPEFRNRLDAIVKFKSLGRFNIKLIAKKFLQELADNAKLRDVDVTWTDGVEEWLMKVGFDPAMGARPMNRAIANFIKIPLAKKMLFNKEENMSAKIDIVDDKISIG
jgi:ATP-dependent Clp protease ATP-binding subunit ClpA